MFLLLASAGKTSAVQQPRNMPPSHLCNKRTLLLQVFPEVLQDDSRRSVKTYDLSAAGKPGKGRSLGEACIAARSRSSRSCEPTGHAGAKARPQKCGRRRSMRRNWNLFDQGVSSRFSQPDESHLVTATTASGRGAAQGNGAQAGDFVILARLLLQHLGRSFRRRYDPGATGTYWHGFQSMPARVGAPRIANMYCQKDCGC